MSDRYEPGSEGGTRVELELELLREFDEALSAYVDGELDPEAAERIAALVEGRRDVADRVAELRAANARLRELVGASVAPDLRTRLHARIAEQRNADEVASAVAENGVASLDAARARRRWFGPAASALAAGLALYLAVGLSGEDETGAGGTGYLPTRPDGAATARKRELRETERAEVVPESLDLAARSQLLADEADRSPARSAGATAVPSLGASPAPSLGASPAPSLGAVSDSAPRAMAEAQLAAVAPAEKSPAEAKQDARVAFAAADTLEESLAPTDIDVSGERVEASELAIAIELDALSDFELIDQLELLEALAALEEREASS